MTKRIVFDGDYENDSEVMAKKVLGSISINHFTLGIINFHWKLLRLNWESCCDMS